MRKVRVKKKRTEDQAKHLRQPGRTVPRMVEAKAAKKTKPFRPFPKAKTWGPGGE